jgi:hypothetical protein
VLVEPDGALPTPPKRPPPPLLAGVDEFPPSRLGWSGFELNMVFVEGAGAAGVVDPNSPPGFEVGCPPIAPPKRPPAGAAPLVGGVAAGVVVPKLKVFCGAGVAATDVAGFDPKRVLAEVVGGVGPAPNREVEDAGGFAAAPNNPPDEAGVAAAPEPKVPPDVPELAPKRPPVAAGVAPVDAPPPKALTVLLGADEAGVVFSFGLFPKPHPVPVAPDPNKLPGGFAVVPVVVDELPKRPPPDDAGAV